MVYLQVHPCMAWLRKSSTLSLLAGDYYLPDGRKTTRITGTTKKREAQQIATKCEEAANRGQQGSLVEKRARKTIADIYAIAN